MRGSDAALRRPVGAAHRTYHFENPTVSLALAELLALAHLEAEGALAAAPRREELRASAERLAPLAEPLWTK